MHKSWLFACFSVITQNFAVGLKRKFIYVIYFQKRNFWCLTRGRGGTRTQQKIFHLKKVDWHLYYVYKEHTALEGIQVVFWIFVFLALSSVPVILIFSWSISLGLILILKILFTLFPNMDYCQAPCPGLDQPSPWPG